jgi:transglutaminase-like putative cysteine protease
MDDSCLSASQQVEFIDDSAIHWPDVKRTRCQFYQRFQYEYPGPIQNLKQRLVIVPADRYGAQHLLDHHLVVNPLPAAVRQVYDTFGNRVLELEVSEADQLVSFETLMIVESESYERQRPIISPAEARHFLKHTALTMPDTRITTVAQQLKASAKTEHDLAQRINDWVFGAMKYGNGTNVKTTASRALEQGQGLCQDYSHIMLSICRTVGLPARYVSGHLLGEGGSHAWVEVVLPAAQGLQAVAFDPTNHCQPHLGYVTVAVGRDYADVSPTSGTFTAPYGGLLTCRKRAGLTLVEYHNGDTVQSKTLL